MSVSARSNHGPPARSNGMSFCFSCRGSRDLFSCEGGELENFLTKPGESTCAGRAGTEMNDPGFRSLTRKFYGGNRFENVGTRTIAPLRVWGSRQEACALAPLEVVFLHAWMARRLSYPLRKVLGNRSLGFRRFSRRHSEQLSQGHQNPADLAPRPAVQASPKAHRPCFFEPASGVRTRQIYLHRCLLACEPRQR